MSATALCVQRRPKLAMVHQCRGQIALCAAKHSSKQEWWADALSSLLIARELDASDEKTHGLLKDCLASAPPGTAALAKTWRQQDVAKLVSASHELFEGYSDKGPDPLSALTAITRAIDLSDTPPHSLRVLDYRLHRAELYWFMERHTEALADVDAVLGVEAIERSTLAKASFTRAQLLLEQQRQVHGSAWCHDMAAAPLSDEILALLELAARHAPIGMESLYQEGLDEHVRQREQAAAAVQQHDARREHAERALAMAMDAVLTLGQRLQVRTAYPDRPERGAEEAGQRHARLDALRAAIIDHADAASGSAVLKAARAMRDRLSEAQRKAKARRRNGHRDATTLAAPGPTPAAPGPAAEAQPVETGPVAALETGPVAALETGPVMALETGPVAALEPAPDHAVASSRLSPESASAAVGPAVAMATLPDVTAEPMRNAQNTASMVAAPSAAAAALAQGQAYSECIVCMDESSTHIFGPCGHLCVCEECSAKIMATREQLCPFCRQLAIMAMRAYVV